MTAQPQTNVHRPIRVNLADSGKLGSPGVVAKMSASAPDNGASVQVDMSVIRAATTRKAITGKPAQRITMPAISVNITDMARFFSGFMVRTAKQFPQNS
jgi:hypothetical protein